MKRMYPKQELGMPRECLHEKIVYLKETISADTTIELEDLLPNWKDYDRIIINCDECNIPADIVFDINVTNKFNGTVIIKGIKSNTLTGILQISQGKDGDAPILHGIYASIGHINTDTVNACVLNDLAFQNSLSVNETTDGYIYGVKLNVYNSQAEFNQIMDFQL